MSSIPSVFKLRRVLDDPRFEGFGTDVKKSFRGNNLLTKDFLPDASTDWNPPRLADVWKPIKVTGRVRPFNDYPCVSLLIPAFSQKAVDALGDYLTDNGELLPLDSEVGKFYACNITTFAPAFDGPNADATWLNDWILLSVKRYAFYPDALQGLTRFRIHEDPCVPYVTDAFVKRATDAGLQGMHFEKIWPHDDTAAAEHQAHRKAIGALKAQSVIIEYKYEGKKPTPSEKNQVTKFAGAIDRALFNPDQEQKAVAVGSLEGYQFLPSRCELRLSCPDADALIKKLLPLLITPEVKGKLAVFKRMGNYEDTTAKQQQIAV